MKRKRTRVSSNSEAGVIVTWFRLAAQCRRAWLQHLWMTEAPSDARATVTHTETAAILADRDSPDAENAWGREQQEVRNWRAEIETLQSGLGDSSGLHRLARVFGLTDPEVGLLALCAAVAFDPALARVCAYLQDHSGRAYMTEELAARMLGLGRTSVWTPEMNVYRWDLVRRRETGTAEPEALVCDPQIRDWIAGKSTLDELLVGAARLVPGSRDPLPEWPVDDVGAWIRQALQRSDESRVRIVVSAPRGGGKRHFASAVARGLGMAVLCVDADAADETVWPRFFLHAQRQTFLDPAVLAWTGEQAARRAWPAAQAFFPIQFLLCRPGAEPRGVDGLTDRHVALPMPEADTRARLWRESSPAAAKWNGRDLHRLAEHHNVWPGDIDHASRLGAHTPEEAMSLMRQIGRSRIGRLADIIESTFTWDDLVLAGATRKLLEAIAFESEERAAFWRQPEARRLFPQGRGLIALFSGPSGTGKTMAAQVIAGRLGQELCRINIAQLISKWVGETPKNIEEVMRVAMESNVVLFFDEADALFARRTTEVRDAQDKFANTDTAFLLQAIESYPGIAILATNLKANIDPAFMRRLRYHVEFSKPDASLQRIIWTKLITALAGETRARALDPVLQLLSTSADATGAQIKFAILGALFEARAEGSPLEARHLLTGLDRELAKEGRAIGPRERERILRQAEGR